MEFRKVLVPIDFSKGSTEALEVSLAHFANAQIFVLHVIDTNQSDIVFEDEISNEFQSKIQDAAYQKLKSQLEARPNYDGKLEPIVRAGRPVNVILETAKSYEADLIVMGSHGNTSITRTFFGHTTYHVSRKAECSTWVIKGESTKN